MSMTEIVLSNSNSWTNEIEKICENLRINCINLCDYHRQRYYHFKSYGKYFRIPLIILASVNSTASVGLQPVLNQEIISGITCLIGMLMGIISSIELYLNIHSNMDLELKQSKEFYTLGIDLYKTLAIHRNDRSENGKEFLNKRYSTYIKLCEASNALKKKLKVDTLTPIDKELINFSRSSSMNDDGYDYDYENNEDYSNVYHKLTNYALELGGKTKRRKSKEVINLNETRENKTHEIIQDMNVQANHILDIPTNDNNIIANGPIDKI